MHRLYLYMELKYLSTGKIALFRMLAQHQALDSREAEYRLTTRPAWSVVLIKGARPWVLLAHTREAGKPTYFLHATQTKNIFQKLNKTQFSKRKVYSIWPNDVNY